MYEAYYGMRERPFDLTPNPRFLFMTPGHREALSTIQYGITGRKGVTLLLGEAGTGKTTLVHAALELQAGDNGRAVFLTNPTLTREEFFEFLAYEFGLSDAAARSKPQFLRELNQTLRDRLKEGVITTLIVDEAQALSDVLLEEVRLLANMETSTEKLLPVVLVGQPELADRLNRQELQQLKQRVALRAALQPLSAHDTAAYVAERIRIAGGDVRTVFTPEAVAAVYECTGGVPRTISVVCDNALVSGFAVDERPVGPEIIAEVSRDFDLAAPTHIRPEVEDFAQEAAALVKSFGGVTVIPTVTAQNSSAGTTAAPNLRPQSGVSGASTSLVLSAPPSDFVPASVMIEPPPPSPPSAQLPNRLRALLQKVTSR